MLDCNAPSANSLIYGGADRGVYDAGTFHNNGNEPDGVDHAHADADNQRGERDANSSREFNACRKPDDGAQRYTRPGRH